ncbi:maltodextrose utilization protein malA [Streptococcus catagoni]|uniref:maltodextrose utilization protein malA n=1 Tax=Streptococcus catagoni TaxID=2654874 RepID=UPI00140D3EA8|nr:maltodextrose utilization protein malA [Streptococcus catagoni]
MLEKKQFPFSYFTYCLSPKAIFANRGQFTWWQNLLIIVFLNSLIMFPVSLHYMSMKTYPMELIVRNSLDPIRANTFSALTQGQIRNDSYQGKSIVIKDKDVALAVLPKKADLKALKVSKMRQIILNEKEWIFVSPEGKEMTASVRGVKKSLADLKDLESVKSFVNQQWYISNKASVLALLLFVFAFLVYVGTVIVIGLGAFFLSLTKRSKLFSITGFSEGFGIMVNCFLIPTLIAILISLFVQNPILVMNCQVFGTLLILTLVFYKTHFRDEIVD